MENRAKNTILVFDEPSARTSTDGLVLSLRRAFAEMTVETADTEKFMRGLDDPRVKVAVLPGIVGEESHIPRLVCSPEQMARQRQFVASGGVMMGFCAGANALIGEAHWTPFWAAERHSRNLQPLFNGAAYCPVGPGQPDITDGIDCITIPVTYRNASGEWVEGRLPYGNGGALVPAADVPVEPLVLYNLEGDRRVAAAWIGQGQGGIAWSGTLPYIDYRDAPQPLPRSYRALVADLIEHDVARRETWHVLTGKVRATIGLPPLSPPPPESVHAYPV